MQRKILIAVSKIPNIKALKQIFRIILYNKPGEDYILKYN